jgi:hypothetical protein
MARNSYSQWTADEDRQLLEMKAAGKTSMVIAIALKRTEAAVHQRFHLLRLRERKRAKD